MRLLYLTDNVYLHGGAEKILIQKLNYWAEVYGYEVALLTSVQRGKPSFWPISGKVRQVDLGIGYPDGSLYHPKNFGRFRQHYKKLKAFVADYEPDAVFVVSQTLFHIITPFAAGKVPTYFEYHTSWYGFQLGYERLSPLHKIKARLLNAITRYAESKYTKIVLLNQAEFDHDRRANSVIIPNFYNVVEKKPAADRKNIAISLGRLSFQKGYDLLLEVWQKLDGEITGWEMHVYGNGENKQALAQALSRYDFKNPFRFFEATDEVDEKLSQASIYVMSSRFETFPMVLLEAMSHELPVASFDCPTGPSSIVTPGEDGILVAAGDTSALAQALSHLVKNRQMREEMGRKGAGNIKRFSPEIVMAQWDALIKAHKINPKA